MRGLVGPDDARDLWAWMDDEGDPFADREPEVPQDDLDFYDRVSDQTAAVDW